MRTKKNQELDPESPPKRRAARAELEFGRRLAGYPLVAKVLRGYKSKAGDGFRQIAADYRASLR